MECKNCKYWDKEEADKFLERVKGMPDLGICKKIKTFNSCTEFREDDGVMVFNFIKFKNHKAFVSIEGNDCYPSLTTRPDFGCNQFELNIKI